ncbi:MAG: DUF349 domain-containing protein [Muribaculaceae bacterium]|nr:DUF349 domain-containing protein [Muribaculaceae bacterium]
MEKNDPKLATNNANEPLLPDTQEAVNIPQPDAISAEPATDQAVIENITEDEATKHASLCTSLDQLIEQAKDIAAKDAADISREDINRLRGIYNSLSHVSATAHDSQDEAGQPVIEDVTPSPLDEEFKTILNQIKEKKAAYAAEQEATKTANLERKNAIIAEILTLADDTDNVNRSFPRYRELQDEFNTLGEVPATEETAIWKKFQDARERFSDNLKINKELRDYDFKKNLEQKELIINEAAALNNEEDIITAFKRLQDLHSKWREIGPVSKELREEIWQRFKDASADVSKRYQAFFEERKAREVENERAKTELCERIEAIDILSIDSFNTWEEKTKEILAAQEEWKKLGFASRKLNTVLFNRFRATCDKFFAAKAAYYKEVKDRMAENLVLKTALADEAEQLKDSTEWKKTTDRLVEMQRQWKTIGAVPKKHSDAVWKRFQQACDFFFEQKKAATSDVRQREHANLQAKRDLIAELDKITDETPKSEAISIIANLQSRWKEIGHVPFKEKDKVYEQFRARITEVRRAHDLSERRDQMERFESSMEELQGDTNKLARERERLARTLETRRTELRTYENNLGFLSAKSKTGNSLVRDFERKIERLKADIEALEQKIRLVDSKM